VALIYLLIFNILIKSEDTKLEGRALQKFSIESLIALATYSTLAEVKPAIEILPFPVI
jgi:hypothetical protein